MHITSKKVSLKSDKQPGLGTLLSWR